MHFCLFFFILLICLSFTYVLIIFYFGLKVKFCWTVCVLHSFFYKVKQKMRRIWVIAFFCVFSFCGFVDQTIVWSTICSIRQCSLFDQAMFWSTCLLIKQSCFFLSNNCLINKFSALFQSYKDRVKLNYWKIFDDWAIFVKIKKNWHNKLQKQKIFIFLKNDQKWSKMIKDDQRWSKVIKIRILITFV